MKVRLKDFEEKLKKEGLDFNDLLNNLE